MDSYIEKCERAKEIQKLWKPKVGDHVWRKYNFFSKEIDKRIWSKDKREEIIILTYASDVDGYFHATKDGETRIFNSHNEAHKKTCVWLPTQEQLQGMSNLSWWLFDARCNYIRCVLLGDPLSEIEVETKEEAGICVLMEKYNKIWDGKGWKVIK